VTWTFAKIAMAGVLTAIPIAAVSLPGYAVAKTAGAAIVLPAPPPADPPTDPPAPPAPAPASHGEYYNPNDYDDWWYYGGAGGGGGGGG
jgi:hypothetical protein